MHLPRWRIAVQVLGMTFSRLTPWA